eukprot:6866025-Prorocentrum_lima.AAC.1
MATWFMRSVVRRIEHRTQRPEGQLALKKGGGTQLGIHQIRGWMQAHIQGEKKGMGNSLHRLHKGL